jgi:hypothetical protein
VQMVVRMCCEPRDTLAHVCSIAAPATSP